MAIDIHDVVSGVIIIFVTGDGEVPYAGNVVERVVNGKVDDIQARGPAHVRSVIGVAVEHCVVRGGHGTARFRIVVIIHLLARADVIQGVQIGALIDSDAIPVAGVIIPTIVLALGPGIEVG